MNDRLIASLIQSDDLFDLCYRFQDNVEIFTESLFSARKPAATW